ncbi:phosphoglycerate mutase-like protein [Meredithblackwellia eburnea MCA 4105]
MSAVVTIVRHGETDHNKAKIIQGHIDTLLNSEGEGQARVVAKYLKSTVSFDEAWTSDLSRAKKTAELIMEQQEGTVPLQTDVRIRERFLGALQGRKVGEGDNSTIEPAKALHARLFSFWDDLFPPTSTSPTSNSNSTPRQILLVSHGGAIRGLVAALLSERASDYTFDSANGPEAISVTKRVTNCSVTQFAVEPVNGKWKGRLIRYADDSHFDESSRAPTPSENVDIVQD